MSILSDFMTKELKAVARLRNIDGYETMPRQQLENIFTLPLPSITTSILISRPRPRPAPRLAFRFPPSSQLMLLSLKKRK